MCGCTLVQSDAPTPAAAGAAAPSTLNPGVRGQKVKYRRRWGGKCCHVITDLFDLAPFLIRLWFRQEVQISPSVPYWVFMLVL
ncbi:hypothetical protein Q5P01_021853 [Channa striata]|uniref:Uncharacterized protein n=1 Tax=Channa striata TaxID=64152 RepID=A0AA88S743_CHASR|nr:hypothetical protein Q5P01_021853 [Channa striata]